jgi:hypothetical protein
MKTMLSAIVCSAALALLVGCVDAPANDAQVVPVAQVDPGATTDPGATAQGNDGKTQAQPGDKADDPKTQPAVIEPAQGHSEPPKPVAGEIDNGVEVDLTAPIEPPSRQRRRMNIDQLDASIKRVTGGIAWMAGSGKYHKNQFAVLSLTLGKPNYTDMTNEDLDPSALFQKFLADAAQSTCKALVTKEKKTSKDKRVLAKYVNWNDKVENNKKAVDQNLSYLLLRYHGRKVKVDSHELQLWRFLFQSATKVTGGNTGEAWRTVCVALMQHPHFYTY